MKRIVRTDDKVRFAQMLKEDGQSNQAIADQFGVVETTIRNWLNPDKYALHKARASRWQDQNIDLCYWRIKERRKLMTQEDRDRESAKQRRRYANDPRFRESLRRLASKYRKTEQGYLAARVRSLALSWSDRYAPIHESLMRAVVGMTKEDFTRKLEGIGCIDHIVPICAFDLTNPEHLVRCLHYSNVRLVSHRKNQLKGPKIPDGLDVMSLPWVETEDAIIQATSFISMQLKKLHRDEARRLPAEMVPDADPQILPCASFDSRLSRPILNYEPVTMPILRQ